MRYLWQNTASSILFIIALFFGTAPAQNNQLHTVAIKAMGKKSGTCVFIDCKTGNVIVSDSSTAYSRYVPCSTFKIWNTLIGAECHLVTSPDQPFYTWDSIPRFLPAWNRDLTLKEAFRVSCVPAFQILAKKIGHANMQRWVDTIQYGDENIAAGVDVFWLPKVGRKSIVISPVEQAQLLCRLSSGGFPFSAQSRAILKETMLIGKTASGTWYGKTGSGEIPFGVKLQQIGWFVGYVESGTKRFSFACFLHGAAVSGADAKTTIEGILTQTGLL